MTEMRLGDVVVLKKGTEIIVPPKNKFNESQLFGLNPHFVGFGKKGKLLTTYNTKNKNEFIVVKFNENVIEKNDTYDESNLQAIQIDTLNLAETTKTVENPVKTDKFVFAFELECVTNANKFTETNLNNIFTIKNDSSLESDDSTKTYLREITPKNPLTTDKKTLKTMKQLFDTIDPDINYSCGGHIHADMRKKTLTQIKGMLTRYLLVRDSLFKKYNKRQLSGNSYGNKCNYLKEGILDGGNFNFNSEHRRDINFNSIKKHCTIEFRLFDGFTSYNNLIEKLKVVYAIVNGGKPYEKLTKSLKMEGSTSD